MVVFLSPNAPQKGSRFKVGGLGVGRIPNVVALCSRSVRKRPQASAKRPQSVRERRHTRCKGRTPQGARARGVPNAAKGELDRTRVPAAFRIRQAKGELRRTVVVVRGGGPVAVVRGDLVAAVVAPGVRCVGVGG